jgi:hypothetical protein
VGVRVGKEVGVGMDVGVTRRVGTSVSARLSPILTTTTRLMIQITMRFRRACERRTVPPVIDRCSTFDYSTAVKRHKRGQVWMFEAEEGIRINPNIEQSLKNSAPPLAWN